MRILTLIILLSIPISFVSAQEVHQDIQGMWRAVVTEVLDEKIITVPGTDVLNPVQTITVRLLDGERKGEAVTFENDYIQLSTKDIFYLNYLVTIDGREFYAVREIDRRIQMGLIILLFIGVIIVFGGIQGFRSLLALLGSLFVIGYVLVPALVNGYSPIPVSVLIASLVLFFAIFLTHGFNRRSIIAFVGTISAVAITGILAYFSIHITGLTGFSSDESVYLNLSTGGQLDFVGLFLAGIIIGALGVLDDAAITQVAIVRELYAVGENLTKWSIYKKAIRIGREHVAALVNTLVLAYTGAALPLLLLFSLSDSAVLPILNAEIFAAEIVRAVVGSIGLVSAVPLTTLLAVIFLDRNSIRNEDGDVQNHVHAVS